MCLLLQELERSSLRSIDDRRHEGRRLIASISHGIQHGREAPEGHSWIESLKVATKPAKNSSYSPGGAPGVRTRPSSEMVVTSEIRTLRLFGDFDNSAGSTPFLRRWSDLEELCR